MERRKPYSNCLAPGLGELDAFARKLLFDRRHDRVRIEDDEVVKGHGLEARCGLRLRGASENGDE